MRVGLFSPHFIENVIALKLSFWIGIIQGGALSAAASQCGGLIDEIRWGREAGFLAHIPEARQDHSVSQCS
jgi:hypothetical protein